MFRQLIPSFYRIFYKFPKYNSMKITPFLYQTSKTLHTSSVLKDLMEFFDDEKNWGAQEVRSGRSWRKEDLRIKSNSDLHKLWYVLLKERNMLLTMQHLAEKDYELFPSPERIDKVEESMENLEEVVRERNRAYYELETGETGERPWEMRRDIIGREYRYDTSEHVIPESENDTNENPEFFDYDKDLKDVNDFQLRLREKTNNQRLFELRKKRKHVKELYETFPDIDDEAVKLEYPDVRLDLVKRDVERDS